MGDDRRPKREHAHVHPCMLTRTHVPSTIRGMPHPTASTKPACETKAAGEAGEGAGGGGVACLSMSSMSAAGMMLVSRLPTPTASARMSGRADPNCTAARGHTGGEEGPR